MSRRFQKDLVFPHPMCSNYCCSHFQFPAGAGSATSEMCQLSGLSRELSQLLEASRTFSEVVSGKEELAQLQLANTSQGCGYCA